jgi:hypothetical protein
MSPGSEDATASAPNPVTSPIPTTHVTHYRGADMPHLGFAIDRAEWEALPGGR